MPATPTRVALKFCGGCNPDYERKDYWEAIRRTAGQRVRWVTLEEGNIQAVLLICGCATACPEKKMPAGVHLVCVKSDQLSPDAVLNLLLEKE